MTAKTVTMTQIREAIEAIGREIEGLDEQIRNAMHVKFSLEQEGRLCGSLAAVRKAEEIDEDEEVVRTLLRRLKTHRTKSINRKTALEDKLMEFEADLRRAKRKAEEEQRARKERVQG